MSFSAEKVKEYEETLEGLEETVGNIEARVSEDQKWVQEAEAEQKRRLAQIIKDQQELWETQGQIKIIKQWIKKEKTGN